MFFLPLFCEPVFATWATKKEHSSELGSQNDSKMEPKMEQKRQRPTLTKHAQALSDCMSPPPLGSSMFTAFLESEKDTNNHLNKLNLYFFCAKMDQKRQRPTLTKHAQALSDCISTPPLGELHFTAFLESEKSHPTSL